ncbi:HK97-gp10 family putative phage morphogenesis protein [Pararhodobacter sp.]|uniref:HK97-gp10 family putative phage morphogenesis protein n=1 Tax=Pararhodobacter sp. TaxID=2127056 RepID=UPI002AFE231B|nr:HK97-gp10 family putative phage morphogenesis protein [Pararhodobacter sp.]
MAKILNLARLERKLKRLPATTQATIRAAMEKSADEIVALARRLVPVDDGALRDSIGWTWGAPPQGALTLGKVARSAIGKGLTITVYAGDSDAFYARWVEFGTKASAARASRQDSRYKRTAGVMTKEYGAHAATPAQPYFFPAYRANRKTAKARIRRATRQAARKVAAGG